MRLVIRRKYVLKFLILKRILRVWMTTFKRFFPEIKVRKPQEKERILYKPSSKE